MKKKITKRALKVISDKKTLEEKLEEKISKSTPQPDQQEIILKLTSKNDHLKKLFEKFKFSQKSLDSMLAEIRRSHNLSGLRYSPQKNISRSPNHTISTSKNHFPSHFCKQHPQNSQHHAPNRYYHHRANHAGISYNSVGMTKVKYERLNNKSNYTVIHDAHNAYRRFRYGITIQLKDFKAM